MKKNFNYLRDAYTTYKDNVDKFYCEQTEPYKGFLDMIVNEQASRGFYNTLFHVIKTFLSDEENQQLFIQIPFSGEIGRTENQQKENFSNLQRVVANILYVSTFDTLSAKHNNVPDSLSSCKIGDIFYTNAKINNPNDDLSARERAWQVMESKTSSDGKRISELLSDRKHFNTPQAKEAFVPHIKDSIRVSGRINDGNDKTPKEKRLKELGLMYKLIRQDYKQFRLNKQFQSALLVGYDDNWENTLINSNCVIDNTVEFKSDYDDEKDYDIIVFIGDKKYLSHENKIRSLIAYEACKKIIYIGTEIFDGYDNFQKAVQYPFSYREIFTYLYTDKVGDCFPNITLHILQNEWLEKTISTLKDNILQMQEISEEDAQQLYFYSVIPFLGIEEMLLTEEELRRLIDEKFFLSDEYTDNYIKTYLELQLPQSNPKKILLEQLKRHHGQLSLLIENHKAYKRKINNFIKNEKNISSNHIVIDVKGDWHAYVDILKHLLSKGVLGTYNFLSYTTMDNIEKFINKEIDAYKAPYRLKVLDNISFNASNNNSSIEPFKEGSLSDFNVPYEVANFFSDNDNQGTTIQRYQLTDEKSNQYFTTGDVLLGSNQISAQELLEDKKEYLPTEVTFYVQPENFQQLMRLKLALPPGQDVEYFSNLWRKVLSDYGNQHYHGNLQTMINKEFLYIDTSFNNKKVKFPQKAKAWKLVKHLQELKLITQEEAQNILNATKANQTNGLYGSELKEALYAYKRTKEKNRIILEIERSAQHYNENITIENMVESALKTAIIIDIKKVVNSKNKHR